MSGNNINSGNELSLDVLLQATVSELPPSDDTVKEVSPWNHAVGQLLLGLALTTIKLEFLMLNYLLPVIGLCLLLLGFRSLRRENRHFCVGYAFTIMYTVLSFVSLSLNATIWRTLDPLAQILPFMSVPGVLLNIGIVVCIRNGFASVQRTIGASVDNGNGTALVVWYIVLSLAAIVTTTVEEYIGSFENFILMSLCTGTLLIVYICILISFCRQSVKMMECSGYMIKPAPVRLASKDFCKVVVGILLFMVTVVYAFFNRYPVRWDEVKENEHANVQEIKSELLSLGIPEPLLDAMTVDDILVCEDAVWVDVDEGELSLKGDERDAMFISTVSVKLAEGNEWRFFYYFEWLTGPDYYRTDAIWILPVYMYETCFRPIGEIGNASGRVLYDRKGVTYQADYYHCTYSPVDFSYRDGISVRPDIVAGFSFPRVGENYRGYITYSAEQISDVFRMNTWFSYYTPSGLLQYPMVPSDQMQHPFLALGNPLTHHVLNSVGMLDVGDEE